MHDFVTLQQRLEHMSLPRVAEACGLSYNTLYKIREGDDTVTVSTLKKLSEYFDARDQG